MSKIKKKSKNNVVHLHNNFIEAIYSLSVDAKKLLLSIILHINDRNRIILHRNEILEEIGIDLKNLNTKHKEEIIEELMTKIITIRDLNNPENWEKYQLLKSTKYKDGFLYTSIYPELLPYFEEAQKRLFTKFNIQNIKPLTSIYAIRIYELCKRFYKDSSHAQISIDQLKKILQIENKYKQISDFRKRVLDVAKKQINKNTDLEIDFELIKEGKKYTKVHFIVKQHIGDAHKKRDPETLKTLKARLKKLYKGKQISEDYAPVAGPWHAQDFIVYSKDHIRIVISNSISEAELFIPLESLPKAFAQPHNMTKIE